MNSENKKIYIFRHGETDYNKRGIIQGRGINASLNEVGQAQANAFYSFYQHIPFEAVLTSTLLRTHQTVAPFIADGLAHETHADIDEISWGQQEGMRPTPDSMASYYAMRAAWESGDYHARVAEGESAYELGERVSRFIQKLYKRPENTLLVCSHGRTMRCMLALLSGQPLSAMDQFVHSNTGLYLAALKNKQVDWLARNDVRHLEA